MRKLIVFPYIIIVLTLSACFSGPGVRRLDPNTVTDLSGYWNDTDVRIVCNSLINDCLSSPGVDQFLREYAAAHGGRQPLAIVGTFRNESSEHINTSIITITMETVIFNSGKIGFAAPAETADEMRQERRDQLMYANEETAARLANETGARLMLTGSVKSIIDRVGRDTVRVYYVDAQLSDIETRERLWMGTNSEIKKLVRQPAYGP